jgi:uncharacterized protein YbgA (DUF1722 family)
MNEQTFETNPEEPELSSAEGEKDVPETDSSSPDSGEEINLENLSKITGREFKNVEDFQKHYKELSSFVGKNPKELEEKAKKYDEEIAKSKTELKKATTDGSSNEDIRELRSKIEEMELLKDNPEASKILSTIKAVATSKNVSMKEAYEQDLKSLLESNIEAERLKNEERNSSVETKSRISSADSTKINQLVADIRKNDSGAAKEELVREYLKQRNV